MKKEVPQHQQSQQKPPTTVLSLSTQEENYNIYLWHHENLHQLIQKAVLQIMMVVILCLISITGFLPQRLAAATSSTFVKLYPITVYQDIPIPDTYFSTHTAHTSKQMVRIQLEFDYLCNSHQLVLLKQKLEQEQKGAQKTSSIQHDRMDAITTTMREFG